MSHLHYLLMISSQLILLNLLQQNPLLCQDSIYITSLASRTYQGSHQIVMESAKKSKTLEKSVMISSSKVRISQSASGKQIRSRVHLLQKNASSKSAMKGK